MIKLLQLTFLLLVTLLLGESMQDELRIAKIHASGSVPSADMRSEGNSILSDVDAPLKAELRHLLKTSKSKKPNTSKKKGGKKENNKNKIMSTNAAGWGSNYFGQLGIGKIGPNDIGDDDSCIGYYCSPVAVVSKIKWKMVSAGYRHNCGISDNNRAFCWGWGNYGRLGNGIIRLPSMDYIAPSPAAVNSTAISKWKSISAGYSHTCGVGLDGKGFCFGFGGNGELGDGKLPNAAYSLKQAKPFPVAVKTDIRWKVIKAGDSYSCGISDDGLAYWWGDLFGDKPFDLTSAKPTPVAMDPTIIWQDISAGSNHVCGVGTDGTGYCVGSNSYGQLGDGTTTTRLTPVVVGSPNMKWKIISAGSGKSCGIDVKGAAYCWGGNGFGDLGDGTRVTRTSPTSVVGKVAKWKAISTFSMFTCGLSSQSQVYCWGRNSEGQLGNGKNDPFYSSVPVPVVKGQGPGSKKWKTVSVGGFSTIGIY